MESKYHPQCLDVMFRSERLVYFILRAIMIFNKDWCGTWWEMWCPPERKPVHLPPPMTKEEEEFQDFLDELLEGVEIVQKPVPVCPFCPRQDPHAHEYDEHAKELERIGMEHRLRKLSRQLPNVYISRPAYEALEELDFCPCCGDILQDGHQCYNGPGEEDGPWADGWGDRSMPGPEIVDGRIKM